MKILNWSTVAYVIKIEAVCMVYKSISDFALNYLSDNYKKNLACNGKNLRNTVTDPQVPLIETCNGQRAFSYHSAGVWNYLDSDVKQASSFKVIKDALKWFILLFTVLFFHYCKAWFPYDRKESQGIAASRNKSYQVCLRLSTIIWKPAKTLFATLCDSLRSLSQAVAEIENFLSLRLTATRCDPLRLMETAVHNFCNSLRYQLYCFRG